MDASDPHFSSEGHTWAFCSEVMCVLMFRNKLEPGRDVVTLYNEVYYSLNACAYEQQFSSTVHGLGSGCTPMHHVMVAKWSKVDCNSYIFGNEGCNL